MPSCQKTWKTFANLRKIFAGVPLELSIVKTLSEIQIDTQISDQMQHQSHLRLGSGPDN